jgi:hypothetical protein
MGGVKTDSPLTLALAHKGQWREVKLRCHCERSEAILVFAEIASSLALLAMTGIP